MKLLIGAGGTGQEVAAAAIRLAYLAGLEIPGVVIFDSDVGVRAPSEGGQTRAQALQSLEDRLLNLGILSRKQIRWLNPTVIPGTAAQVNNADDLYSHHGSLTDADETLLGVLLDERQRRTPVNNGFHGQPAVGSLVFSGAWQRGAFDELFEQLRTGTGEQDGLRVVLAGSVAGGVGTAVLPLLVRELAKLRQSAGGARVDLLALLQLPWFRLARQAEDPLSREPDVNQAEFDRNAACLLRGYLGDALTRNLDAVFLLGLPEAAERASQGGDRQAETRHYLSVCAGMAALNLLRPEATSRLCGADWKGTHAFALGEARTPSPLDGPVAGPALYLDSGRTLTVRKLADIARSLTAFTDALEFEMSVNDAAWTHHGAIFEVLRGLQSRDDRDRFTKHVESFHELHGELHQWLRECLESRVGPRRADNVDAFVPAEGWQHMFDTGVGRVLHRVSAGVTLMPTARKLVTSLGKYQIPVSGATGPTTAHQFVVQARGHLLGRL
jgi:hypothetical protein